MLDSRPRTPTGLRAEPSRRRRAVARTRFSPGVVAISGMLSALHLLNFVNYTVLSGYFNPPLTRSALLAVCSLLIASHSVSNLRFHATRSWDMYAICLLAILSTVYSFSHGETLKYAVWLTLTVYVGTELAARMRTSYDLVMALLIVLLPASALVTVANVTVGPVIDNSGRHFGALGSYHVDTAFAMDFVCLFLALRVLPGQKPPILRRVQPLMWLILIWALYQVLFGLTRSVWLGVILAGGLYMLRGSLSLKGLTVTFFVLIAVVLALSTIDFGKLVPEAIQQRLQITEERYEAGEIDPRVEAIHDALKFSANHPEGRGYIGIGNAHNSYFNILLNLGWIGFAMAMVAIWRSARGVIRAGMAWLVFFSIGAAPLLVHAFFETNDLPGQANFIPLLLWYALSRSRFVEQISAPPTGRPAPAGRADAR